MKLTLPGIPKIGQLNRYSAVLIFTITLTLPDLLIADVNKEIPIGKQAIQKQAQAAIKEAKNGSYPCISGLSLSYSKAEIEAMQKLIGSIDEGKREKFVAHLNNSFYDIVSGGEGSIKDTLHEIIGEHIGITRKDPKFRAKVQAVWNLNSHHFMTTHVIETRLQGETWPQRTVAKRHLLKRMVDKHTRDIELFVKKMGKGVNVNDMDLVEGKWMTIVDYIDHVIDNPDQDAMRIRLKNFRRHIIKFHNAKTAAEILGNDK